MILFIEAVIEERRARLFFECFVHFRRLSYFIDCRSMMSERQHHCGICHKSWSRLLIKRIDYKS